MTHVTCGLTVENRDQLRNPTHGNRVWATSTLQIGLVVNGRVVKRNIKSRLSWLMLLVTVNIKRARCLRTRVAAIEKRHCAYPTTDGQAE